MYVGGSAVPQALIEAFEKRYGLKIIHAWGMTEMAPLGTVAHLPPDAGGRGGRRERIAYRAKQGRPAPFVEIRARNEDGLVPWDGADDGRARGARAVDRQRVLRQRRLRRPVHRRRLVQDRRHRDHRRATRRSRCRIATKDLIKSGGEWISSVALECALMGHPSVAEAAVIPVASREMERAPAGRRRAEAGRDRDAGRAAGRSWRRSFAKFWLPDAFEFVDAIPRTSAGKFKKSELRERFKDYQAAE